MEMKKQLNIDEDFNVIGLHHRALWYPLTDNNNTSLILVQDYNPCSVCGVRDPGYKHNK